MHCVSWQSLIWGDGITNIRTMWILHWLATYVRERAALFIWCWIALVCGLLNKQCLFGCLYVGCLSWSLYLGWKNGIILYPHMYCDMKSLQREDAVMLSLLYLSGFTRWENKPETNLNWLHWNNLPVPFCLPLFFFILFFLLGWLSVKTKKPGWNPASEWMMVFKWLHLGLSFVVLFLSKVNPQQDT